MLKKKKKKNSTAEYFLSPALLGLEEEASHNYTVLLNSFSGNKTEKNPRYLKSYLIGK